MVNFQHFWQMIGIESSLYKEFLAAFVILILKIIFTVRVEFSHLLKKPVNCIFNYTNFIFEHVFF